MEVLRERGVWPTHSACCCSSGGVLPVMLEDSESVRRRAERLDERRLGMVMGCEGERLSRETGPEPVGVVAKGLCLGEGAERDWLGCISTYSSSRVSEPLLVLLPTLWACMWEEDEGDGRDFPFGGRGGGASSLGGKGGGATSSLDGKGGGR